MTLVDPESLDVTALPSLPLAERSRFPNIPAVYFVLTANNELLYIGRAKSLCFRWQQHHRLAHFSKLPHLRIAWLSADSSETLSTIERVLIRHFQPRYNGSRTGAPLRQTTVRVQAELLRKARFYLDEEDKSLQEFLAEQLENYVYRREQERDSGVKQDCA